MNRSSHESVGIEGLHLTTWYTSICFICFKQKPGSRDFVPFLPQPIQKSDWILTKWSHYFVLGIFHLACEIVSKRPFGWWARNLPQRLSYYQLSNSSLFSKLPCNNFIFFCCLQISPKLFLQLCNGDKIWDRGHLTYYNNEVNLLRHYYPHLFPLHTQ